MYHTVALLLFSSDLYVQEPKELEGIRTNYLDSSHG